MPDQEEAEQLDQEEAEQQDTVADLLPEFRDAREFYDEFLSHAFARRYQYGSVHWCKDWTKHFEARMVVTDLHTTYEVLRLEQRSRPFWRAAFMRDWGYPLMSQLFAPTGTFSECTKDAGHRELGVLGRDLVE